MGTKEKALKFLLDGLSLTLNEAKHMLLNSLEYGSSSISHYNVRLMYTDNQNYAGGARYGKGKGFYLIYKSQNTMVHEYKIK